MSTWDLQKIQSLITDQVEESTYLEYKAADALQKTDGKKKEIAKDISALGNAAGGIIIYGMKEYDDPAKKHLPEKIDPVNRIEISKEWLEQIINSNIKPRMEGISITPVTYDDAANTVLYIVDVPQSGTAHQSLDKRYYKRYNFQVLPMEDYEIRDTMNRIKHPNVILNFGLQKKDNEYYLCVSIKNIGKVFASYVNYFVDMPPYIIHHSLAPLTESRHRKGSVEFAGENTVRDIVDATLTMGGIIEKPGPSRFSPVLPGTESRPFIIRLTEKLMDFDHKIYWTIYADNAEMKEGCFSLSDLIPTIKYLR